MVTFTCQNCNSSLKKNQVEKHYQFKCRRSKNLTCIDCLKDFLGEEYVKHTSCMTENQKYGGKDYVQKPMGVKQNAWVEVCQKALERKDLSGPQRHLLMSCSEHSNIPRIRKKFHNFVGNVAKAFRGQTSLIDEVFDIVEEEWKIAKGNSSQTQNVPVAPVAETTRTENFNFKEPDERQDSKRKRIDSGSAPACNNSKRKNDPIDISKVQIGSLFHNAVHSVLNGIGHSHEPKNPHKPLHLPPPPEVARSPPPQAPKIDELTKKERKKLKKEKKYKAEIHEIESTTKPEDLEKPLEERKKKKKKQKKSKEDSANHVEENGAPEEDSEVLENEVEPTGKFDWSSTILQILQSSKDKEMSLKKLSKKVLAEYQFQKGDREPFEKISAKFNKKVVRTLGVQVVKDRAILIDDE